MLSFLLKLILVFVSYIISQLIYCAFEVMLSPLLGYKVQSYQIFGFMYELQHDGRFRFIRRQPNLSCLCHLVIDNRKADKYSQDRITRNGNILLILCAVIPFMLSGGACELAYVIGSHELLIFTFICIAIFSLIKLVITIVIIGKASSKDSILNYCEQIKARIRSGEPIEHLEMKSLEELGASEPKPFVKAIHLELYATYLEASEQYDKLSVLMSDNEDFLNALPNIRSYMFMRYFILNYYSRVNVDYTKAVEAYKKIEDMLLADQDANAYRIRGFYALNILNDKDTALEFANQANSVVDHFSIGSEREYEKMLIHKLFEESQT